jgi:hypothetical protein
MSIFNLPTNTVAPKAGAKFGSAITNDCRLGMRPVFCYLGSYKSKTTLNEKRQANKKTVFETSFKDGF